MKIELSIMKKHLYLIIGIVIVLIAGCLFLPDLFYDQFIWKYFWGPIISDVQGGPAYHNGVLAEDKYTLFSELIYGILIIIVLFSLYKLIKKWNIIIDWIFFISILPYVLIGSIGRVLEDANFFTSPIVYWFVSPLIYIQLVFWVVLLFILGKTLTS